MKQMMDTWYIYISTNGKKARMHKDKNGKTFYKDLKEAKKEAHKLLDENTIITIRQAYRTKKSTNMEIIETISEAWNDNQYRKLYGNDFFI